MIMLGIYTMKRTNFAFAVDNELYQFLGTTETRRIFSTGQELNMKVAYRTNVHKMMCSLAVSHNGWQYPAGSRRKPFRRLLFHSPVVPRRSQVPLLNLGTSKAQFSN